MFTWWLALCVCVWVRARVVFTLFILFTLQHITYLYLYLYFILLYWLHTPTHVYIFYKFRYGAFCGKKKYRQRITHVCSAANSTQCTSTAHSFMVCQFKYEFTINKCGEYRQAEAVCWLPQTRAQIEPIKYTINII